MRRRSAEAWIPMAFLSLVALLAVAILPSALRPPPDQANSSAALSPDAPPDEEPDAIISSFQQAGSSTAGAQTRTESSAPPPPTTTTLPPEPQASAGLCFGDPPLQTESLYAPECAPAFVGDNGGSTWKNVTGDLVRIGFWHSLGTPNPRGPISREPIQNEGGAYRTHRVLQEYFNQRYETYGRFVQLVAIEQASRSEADEQEAATKADEEWDVFASNHLDLYFCDELVRRDLVCFNANPFPDDVYEQYAPNFYSYQMKASQNDRIAAEHICKRLAPFPARWAGGLTQGQPRKFGALYEDNTGRSWEDLSNAMKAECGIELARGYNIIDPSKDPSSVQQIAVAMAQMQQEGITSIVMAAELIGILTAMQQADGAQYEPEWLVYGSYGLDFNIIGKTYPASQAQHVFGMSGWEIPRRAPRTECYQAYKSIDPSNDPDGTVCNNFFFAFQQIFIAIQEAGPNLTPETIRQGLYDYGYRFPPEPWAVHGGYSPGDNSFIDEFGEIWWDPTAPDVTAGGAPGAFRWVNDGQRYGVGDVPEGEPDYFGDNGIHTV